MFWTPLSKVKSELTHEECKNNRKIIKFINFLIT